MPVHVTSEIGRLRAVIVHSPGNELDAVTPGNRVEYLYDDIIDVETARREHRRFVAILERFTTVHQVRDLLAEIARATPRPAQLLIRETMDIVPSEPLARDISRAAMPSARADAHRGTRGAARAARPDAERERVRRCPPLPNLFFTRDSGMVAGDHVLIGSMRYAIRWTEAIIMKALFTHHPLLANAGILYDGASERRVNYTLEGGDVHSLRHDLVVHRLQRALESRGHRPARRAVLRADAGHDIIIVVMPARATAIHLDMIFTQVDREHLRRLSAALHRAGAAVGAALAQGRAARCTRRRHLRRARACGMPMEPIFCGGERRRNQEREQWASGCNFAALRPGRRAVVRSATTSTLREMEQRASASSRARASSPARTRVGRRRPRGHHLRGRRAGARRRRPALHDVPGRARRPVELSRRATRRPRVSTLARPSSCRARRRRRPAEPDAA